MLLQTQRYTFGDYVLDEAARQLTQGEKLLPVTGRSFDLLMYMVKNPGRPLLKKELLEAVWPDSFVEDANLTQNVFVLRKALGEDGSRIIQTLPGRGYQFAAQVVPAAGAELMPVAEAIVAAPVTTPVTVTHSAMRVIYEEESEEHVGFWRSPLTLGLAGLVLILLCVAGWLGWQRYEDHVGGPPVQAVLANQEGSTGDPVLDRTLTSVLRFQLAQSPFVTLVPASTVRQTLVQMKRNPDEPLTAPVAEDLCERTASQAVLTGSVARAGQLYLLTEEATSCVDGSMLGTAKQQVTRVEDLPGAIDKLGASIRQALGESRRTIARYNHPLAKANTASLEALKDFSQANYIAQSGRFAEAIALQKQAVALDPNFAAAYLNLSLFAANALDPTASREYLKKAYELRAGTTEPIRLAIAAKYDTDVNEDYDQSVRDYQAWIEMYPRSPQAWAGITQMYREMGDHQSALKSARRVAELVSNNVVAYQALADAQMKTGDFAAARATCALALSKGFDGENIRFLLLRLGHLTDDQQLIGEQEAWSRAHPDAAILLTNEAEFALQDGDFVRADELLGDVDAAFRRQGAPEAAISVRETAAARYFAFGEDARGHKLLEGTRPDPENYDDLLALTEAGQADLVARLLASKLATHPQATLWKLRFAPLLRGQMLLDHGKPQDAIRALEPTRQLDGASLDGYYLRGMAYKAAGQMAEAEREFRNLLSHRAVEPTSSFVPLARLNLARVLLARGNRQGAAEAYQMFLAQWAHAAASSPLVMQVHAELAQVAAEPLHEAANVPRAGPVPGACRRLRGPPAGAGRRGKR